jgi:gliding motility-associated-like protein
MLLCGLNSYATHIVGGEIIYRHLFSDFYEIKLLVYRDCFTSSVPFDTPGRITIFNNAGVVQDVIEINAFTQSTLPISIDNRCVFPPSNICYQEAEYLDTVQLPPITGGYYIVYQRCCRNNTILNLTNPGDQGASFMEHIPGSETGAQFNNSPRFNSLPPTFICANSFFSYNHSATDPDGDLLVYEFSKAYKGLDRCCPVLTDPNFPSSPNTGNTNGCIQPIPSQCPSEAYPPIAYTLTVPNYDSVDYQFGYTSKNPFGIGSNVTLNPNTGVMSGTPNTLGQYVVTVSAKEFRNGVLIGVHRREFQFNVTTCLKTIISSIITPSILCKNNVAFNATTLYTGPNAVAYIWNFGNPQSGVNNTSTLQNPNHAFTDTGTYTITLTTYDVTDSSCNDVITKTVKVVNPVAANFVSPFPLCKKTPVAFTSSIQNNPNNLGLTYNWNFGNPQSGLNNTSTLINPNHIFTDTGTYLVQLITSVPTNMGCGDTIIKPIKVTEYVKANFMLPNDICNKQPFQITNNSTQSSFTPPLIYNWTFANANLSASNDTNPVISVNASGLYDIFLVINSSTINGCRDSIKKQVDIKSLKLQASVPATICNGLLVPYSASTTFIGSVKYAWNFGDLSTNNDTSSSAGTSYTFPSLGNYTYTVNAVSTTNSFCKDSITGLVKLLDIVTPDFISKIPFCANLPVKLSAISSHLAPGPLIHAWQFLQTNESGDSVVVAFPDSGNYTVILTSNNPQYPNCSATAIKSISIGPRIIANFKLDSLYCRNLNEKVLNLSKGSPNPLYQWTFNSLSSTIFSSNKEPLISINDTGTKNIYLIYKDLNHPECSDTSDVRVRISPPPQISASGSDEKCDGANTKLNANVINPSGRPTQIYWQAFGLLADSGSTVQITFPSNGLFPVTAIVDVPSLENCKDTSDIIEIKITGRGELFIPNAFSPNKDNNNDVFKIEGPPYESFLMIVFNRFGEKVFESNDQGVGWNGKIKEEDAEPGVFAYYVKVKCPDGSTQIKKGNVTLLR